MTSCLRYPKSPAVKLTTTLPHYNFTRLLGLLYNGKTSTSQLIRHQSFSAMSWMDSWSRPNKHATTPPPLYLTVGDSVPYCHSCGRVIGERRKHGGSEVKYCSARCRNSKPGITDRKIESVFAALLNGATPESLKEQEEEDQEVPQEKGSKDEKFGKHEKKHKKKGSKIVKGDHRIIVECQTVQDIVFQREKDPEKVYGRRKNRKARFVVEKPEDWKSVDMVDKPAPTPGTSAAQPGTSLTSEDDNNDDTVSDSDSEEQEGGIVLENARPPNTSSGSATEPHGETLPDTVEYGYGSGKVRPPQEMNDVNGSVGGEKGWAERIEETEDMKLKRREGQRRADEREMVRKAARRGCAFGFTVEGEEEKRKCEAVMKGVVVESSFAKGEWGVRWRERV
jgi:hypothetical protein